MEDPSAPRPVGPTMQPVSGVPLEVSDHSSLSLSLLPLFLFLYLSLYYLIIILIESSRLA